MYSPRAPVGAFLACSALLLVVAGTVLVRGQSGSATPAAAEAPPAPPPPPQPHWNADTLHQLLAAVDASADEGLRPKDYQRGVLAGFLKQGGAVSAIEQTADTAAKALAHDYIDGRIKNPARFDWHIEHSPAQLVTLDVDIANAVNGGRLTDYIKGLLPTDPRYAALRQAYADTPATEHLRRDAIRASMERWRWMPRVLGDDYIWVNIPTYKLQLYRGGQVKAEHVVVVGAPKTPTPQLSANVGHIIVNPWWTLPPTVLREGKKYSPARGYVWQKIGGKMFIRQKPGPMNALGRMKIDMPNAWAIYLHDTPAKSGFAQPMRALSHGCIRVQNIPSLASELYDPAAIDTALETYTMKSLPMQATLPVYIVYFTAAPDADSKVVTYGDPYDRDARMIAALDGVKYHPPAKPKPPLPKAEAESVTVNRAVDEPERAQP
ncbi:L,D-transpeptidase family protein [Sphingomonas sp. CGMCC 1.13654]|uniref:L,D-transpeptidase family protein n=1 Tax=Sphingomonas chungangi TaxID=2683589 RepID=A0A838L3M3_9SPHN|nr:L,D-transpeptidase family protein [Sphingomonas chungangi]MBA2934083.1 L,D-transpeptidase family protein [Sphingomonas chungangi]MVW57124.1 L,D-transpeptidase family protein [Sphingomonas chungangi]